MLELMLNSVAIEGSEKRPRISYIRAIYESNDFGSYNYNVPRLSTSLQTPGPQTSKRIECSRFRERWPAVVATYNL